MMNHSLLFATIGLVTQTWVPQWSIYKGNGEATATPTEVRLSGEGVGRSTIHPRAMALLPKPLGLKWQIALSITYRRLGESGGRVALQQGEERLIWTGSDSIYGKMSTFLGSKMVDTRTPEIGRSYRFEFRRDNDEFTTWLDGKILGRSRATKNPDTLFVGSDDSTSDGTDTYLDLSTLSLKTAPPSSPREVQASSSLAGGIDGMRLVLGVDSLSQPPAVPAGDRLRILTKESGVLVSPGETVELAPVSNLPDFNPAEVALFADGNVVRHSRIVGKTMPTFTYEAPNRPGVSVRLRVRAANDERRQVDLMKIDLKTSSELTTKVKPIVEADKVRLTGSPGQSLFAFLGDSYLGRVLNPEAFALDVRRLPPGRYELHLVTSNQDGVLLPPVRTPINVRPRYAMATDHDLGVLNLEGKVDGTTLQVRMEPESSAARSLVYLRGALVAVKDGRAFTCYLPMGDVPSGPIEVQVVGVGEDGTLYPPENLTLRVKNPVWDARQARDARAKRLVGLQESLAEDDAKVSYWYSRAIAEPEFRSYTTSKRILTVDEFGRMSSISYVSSITVKGNAGEYLAECHAAIARRASKRLQIGKLMREMGLMVQARITLERCIEEAGNGSATALSAKSELALIRKPPQRELTILEHGPRCE